MSTLRENVNDIKLMLESAQQLADSTDERVALYLTTTGSINYERLSCLEEYERILEVVSPQEPEIMGLLF